VRCELALSLRVAHTAQDSIGGTLAVAQKVAAAGNTEQARLLAQAAEVSSLLTCRVLPFGRLISPDERQPHY
jgi:hypothetical protein